MLAQISRCAILAALFLPQTLLMMPQLSHAAEWTAEPSARVASEYNDNIRLLVQPHNSVHGTIVSPKLNLGVRSDNWRLNGSAEYERKNYSGATDLDTNNQYFLMSSSYQTERSTWRLDGSMTKTSVLTYEQYAGGEAIYFARDQQGSVWYGYTPVTAWAQAHRTQEVRKIAPSWSWSLDERKQLLLSYEYNAAHYVDGGTAGLSDNSTHSVTAQIINHLDVVNQIFFSAGFSAYRSPDIKYVPEISVSAIYLSGVNPKVISSESKSASYQAGITHVFSDTMRGNLSGGVRATTTDQTIQTCLQPSDYNTQYLFGAPPCLMAGYEPKHTSVSSSLFSGNLERQFENTRAGVTLSRTYSPTPAGDQAKSDTLNFDVSRSITARLTGNLSTSASKYSSETGNVKNIDYKYYQIGPGLRWQWTQELDINMNYRYSSIKRSWESEAATSSYLYLGLIYQWPKISFSR